jgi:hypothetical protein
MRPAMTVWVGECSILSVMAAEVPAIQEHDRQVIMGRMDA